MGKREGHRRFGLALGIGALCCLGACGPLDIPPSYSWDPGKQQICPFPFAPTLDGDLGDTEWDEKNLWQAVDHTMGSKPATSDADASFEFACVADSENMYFAFRIRDNVINTKGWTECDAYENDSIEIFVDQYHHPPDNKYNGDDSQIVIGADNRCVPGSGAAQIGGCEENMIFGAETKTRACSQETDKGWQAEVAVPLQLSVPGGPSEMGWKIEPKHELIVGFQTGYNDRDNNPIRDHKLIWGISDRNTDPPDQSYQDPSRLEELLFYAVDTEGN
jgi:hypothetical protein